jgi:CTP:molybdopterin cytidylyltransferase MocA
MIAAIILAAGSSSRMGHHKALLKLRGRTFLETILDACAAAGLSRRVVVLGKDGDKVLQETDLSGAAVVWNRSAEGGPINSLRIGLEAIINHPVDAALVWHVDRPCVLVKTLQALLDSYRDTRAAVVVPEFRGRRGHPVLFGREVFGELLGGAAAAEGARGIVRADPGRVRTVSVEDPAVIEDVNTPEDYQAVLARLDARGE